MTKKLVATLGLAALIAWPTLALAQAEPGALDAADSGDTAWLLTAAVLGLIAALPGLALYYAGRAQRGGFVAVAMQAGAIVAVVSLLWVMVGYTLAFGTVGSGWLGAGNAWMLLDLGNVRGDSAVPESAFVLFELAFALIAPVLMTGAWIDRARFGWVVAFSALWSLMVYAPVAHWIWGGGWLANRLGTIDYAGGIVVHTTAGVSALVVALLLGRRATLGEHPAANAPGLSLGGTFLAWIGSISLAGGAALAANDDAASAIINTHAAACAGALTWLLIDRIATGKARAPGLGSGVIAGLAAISSSAGLVAPGAAILFGAVGALAGYVTVTLLRDRLAIDDTAGVFAVNGVGGMVGAVMLALFLAPVLGGTGYGEGFGPVRQLLAQGVGVGAVAAWSAIASVIAGLMVSMVVPMRVTEAEERAGLDASSHGEPATATD
ncbi:ammonium transporter [Novosphingobium sp.]|uniref:ammonium transporter n=1 Tax=Novosphingobium sp. TaxID=1874826 RepID=UPI0038B78BD8